MKKKPENYVSNEKVVRDWTDKKNFSIHYGMLKIYVRHGVIVVKDHEIISIKQSNWLEKYIIFNTHKRKRGKKKLEKDFVKIIKIGFFGKVLENLRKRLL